MNAYQTCRKGIRASNFVFKPRKVHGVRDRKLLACKSSRYVLSPVANDILRWRPSNIQSKELTDFLAVRLCWDMVWQAASSAIDCSSIPFAKPFAKRVFE